MLSPANHTSTFLTSTQGLGLAQLPVQEAEGLTYSAIEMTSQPQHLVAHQFLPCPEQAQEPSPGLAILHPQHRHSPLDHRGHPSRPAKMERAPFHVPCKLLFPIYSLIVSTHPSILDLQQYWLLAIRNLGTFPRDYYL